MGDLRDYSAEGIKGLRDLLEERDDRITELEAALADMKEQRDRALSDVSDVMHLGAQKNGRIDGLEWVIKAMIDKG